jgi:hypothetical protein
MIVMIHHNLSSVRSLARFLEQQPELAFACGFDPDTIPSYRTLSRRFKTLDNPVMQVVRELLSKMIALGIVNTKIVIIDATPLQAKGNLPKGERSIKPSDPEARFGFQKHGKEVYFGYKLHLISTTAPLMIPLAWQVTPANQQEVNFFIPLFRQAMAFLPPPQEIVADASYDSRALFHWAEKHHMRLTTPINKGNQDFSRLKPDRLKRHNWYKSKRGQRLYQRRTDIERLNGQTKDVFWIDPLPLVRLKRISTYINLVLLAYLTGVYYNHTNGREPRAIKSLVA